MKTFQEFTTEAYGRGSRPVRGRDYDDYKDWKPSLYKSGSHRTQDKTPPTHPAAHLKPKKKSAAERMDAAGKRLGLPEETIDEILMVTPTTKKTDTKSQSKPKRDPYGEDPAVTRKRLAVKIKKLKEEDEIDEGIGMTMANALGNPPALSKRMKLKQALIINKIKSDAEKNKKKKYSGKASTNEEYVQELFVTRKSSEQRVDEKRKKKVAELIRLMKHAKDTHSDVARKPVANEEYVDESSLSRVVSKTNKGGVAIMSSDRGDKTKKQKQQR